MIKYCNNCESMHEIIEKQELREYQIKETKVSAEITILECKHCHEEIYDRDVEIKNDILLFDEYKRKNHLLTSAEIIKIREGYGLSQTALSKILGFGIKTITRYENGAIQDNTHDNLLRLMIDEKNFFILWLANKKNLTDSENLKIKNVFMKKEIPVIKYDYKECYRLPNNINIFDGGFNYDGCQ